MLMINKVLSNASTILIIAKSYQHRKNMGNYRQVAVTKHSKL